MAAMPKQTRPHRKQTLHALVLKVPLVKIHNILIPPLLVPCRWKSLPGAQQAQISKSTQILPRRHQYRQGTQNECPLLQTFQAHTICSIRISTVRASSLSTHPLLIPLIRKALPRGRWLSKTRRTTAPILPTSYKHNRLGTIQEQGGL